MRADLLADVLLGTDAPHGRQVDATRADLAAAFAVLGFRRGAEIGVERGHYSAALLRSNPDLSLLAVDAWTAYPEYRDHVTQAKLDAFYQETADRLRPYAGATLVRAFSVPAAQAVPDGALDFVYLDANHSFEQVTADLAAWVPKVRVGGIVAGHDYGRRSVGRVREAVETWVTAHRVAPLWILAGDRSPSFAWRVAA